MGHAGETTAAGILYSGEMGRLSVCCCSKRRSDARRGATKRTMIEESIEKMDDYAFRRMDSTRISQVSQFIASHWSESSYHCRPGWFEWQFLRNPEGCHVELCTTNGTIVAMSGFLACTIAIGGRRYRAAFSTSTMVDSAHQRRGIGQRIHLRRLEAYDFGLSSGQSPANLNLYLKMGWRPYGSYHTLKVVRHLQQPANVRAAATELLSYSTWRLKRPRRSDGYELEITREVPQWNFDTDRFGPGCAGPIWDRAYIIWRYVEHPYFVYDFALVRKRGRFLGFAVIRQSDRATVLVDLYCAFTDTVDLLKGLGLTLPGRLITGQFCGTVLARRFLRAGWLSVRGERLVGKSMDPTLDVAAGRASWCFLGGDSDRDR